MHRAHKSQFLKRKERWSGIKQKSFCLPLRQTDSLLQYLLEEIPLTLHDGLLLNSIAFLSFSIYFLFPLLCLCLSVCVSVSLYLPLCVSVCVCVCVSVSLSLPLSLPPIPFLFSNHIFMLWLGPVPLQCDSAWQVSAFVVWMGEWRCRCGEPASPQGQARVSLRPQQTQQKLWGNNNNSSILDSSQREIKAVIQSHNDVHYISIVLSHETHAHTHS